MNTCIWEFYRGSSNGDSNSLETVILNENAGCCPVMLLRIPLFYP